MNNKANVHFLFSFLMWCVVWLGIISLLFCCKTKHKKNSLTVSSTLLSWITFFPSLARDYLHCQTYYFSEKLNPGKVFLPAEQPPPLLQITFRVVVVPVVQLNCNIVKKIHRTKKIITVQYIIIQKLWQGRKSCKKENKKTFQDFPIHPSTKLNLIRFLYTVHWRFPSKVFPFRGISSDNKI